MRQYKGESELEFYGKLSPDEETPRTEPDEDEDAAYETWRARMDNDPEYRKAQNESA